MKFSLSKILTMLVFHRRVLLVLIAFAHYARCTLLFTIDCATTPILIAI